MSAGLLAVDERRHQGVGVSRLPVNLILALGIPAHLPEISALLRRWANQTAAGCCTKSQAFSSNTSSSEGSETQACCFLALGDPL
jgi:hypothetical protein